ncbi:MAG TPA: hypothetical protein DCQ78_00720 [Ruminococcus sp.]|nr:hypothetical protein [Ruminococcus sp.]
MIENIKKDDFGMEGSLYIEAFDSECNVVIDIEASLNYAEKCAEMISNLSPKALKIIEKALRIYCLTRVSEHRHLLDTLTFDVRTVKNMLECVYPQTVYIDAPEGYGNGVRLECECDWEEENEGLITITVKDNEVLYVGPSNDLSPFDELEYFHDDENNFVNKI